MHWKLFRSRAHTEMHQHHLGGLTLFDWKHGVQIWFPRVVFFELRLLYSTWWRSFHVKSVFDFARVWLRYEQYTPEQTYMCHISLETILVSARQRLDEFLQKVIRSEAISQQQKCIFYVFIDQNFGAFILVPFDWFLRNASVAGVMHSILARLRFRVRCLSISNQRQSWPQLGKHEAPTNYKTKINCTYPR